MNSTLSEIIALSKECNCGNKHIDIPIDNITISYDALEQAVLYIEEKFFQRIKLVADKYTFEVAGEKIERTLKNKGIDYSICLVKPNENDDVVANEASIVQVMIETPQETDVLLAIGSGTMHDIVRFSSYKMGKPFISIPTAPSVDGFNSMGAPLVIRGYKTTFQTHSPIAVFADLKILKHAPKKMIAAGFGDMLAKFTSLADWRFGHLVAGEPYCPLVARITKEALESCVTNVEKIADADDEGILILIEALVKSGLAMLLFGQSHPASGAEHHLSHFWEMDFIQKNRPQVLHGAKVGVSTSFIVGVYKQVFLPYLCEPLKQDSFSKTGEYDEIVKKVLQNKDEIYEIYQSIPEPIEIRTMINKAGGPQIPGQLGIDQDLIERSLKEAHHLRDRFTVLKFLNEVVKIEEHLIS